ncbi:zinc finger MYM-type protein 1-like [Lytechinus variegatus]|uniref:zinc finger MYM-type protein 1-like n=1 Tax=Lytechinus variegatus TaxID=7654 RepID=UPI001BB1E871|nr:zinc finger MYM-type protein 1-like [Lytechinus variegatus]
MDIRRFVKPKDSGGGGGASTSRERDESVEPSKKRQKTDSDEVSVEPESQAHTGTSSSHHSDQRTPSSTDHFADTNDAANGDDDDDFLGNAVNVNSDAKPSAKPTFRQYPATPGPADISQSPDDGPIQPGRTEHFNFQKSNGRKFRPEWYNAYPWMEFSASENKVYCYVCLHFSVGECAEKAFTTDGFHTWKKCTGESAKNNKLVKHKSSEDHVNSAAKYKAYLESKQQKKTVMDHINEIKEEIGQCKYFAVLVDETKDLSKQEQMSFVIRYLYDEEVHEEFMGFRCADGLDAASLSESILDELKSLGIDVNYLVGQGYDGANVMSGKLSGVQERIRRKIPQALYVHCFAHRLNLVIVETVKSVVPVADFFAVLQSSYNFLSGSHVHEQWIRWQQKMYPDEQPVEFKGMSDTRWASQVRAVGAIRKRFHCFVEFLKHTDTHDDNRERALNARGLLSQLDQTFIYCMLLMDEVLSSAKSASDTLQSVNLDYLRAADLIESLLEDLGTFRSDTKADSYFSESLTLAKENGLKCSNKRRQTSAPSTMDDFVVLSKLGKRDKVSDAASMKIAILNPTVDVFLGELSRRFSNENLQIFRSLAALDPKSHKFLDFETVKPLAVHYKLNLEDIKTEMRLVKRMIERSDTKLETLIDVAEHLKPLTMAFEELYKLVKIAAIIPVSTASCERTFSKLKLIKNHLRANMTNSRLKSLAVISVHRERALAIDLEEVVDRFIMT